MVLLAIALLAGSGERQTHALGPPKGWVPSLLGLAPGEATFSDVSARLGDTPVFRSSEGEPQMCYTAERKGDSTAVILESVADYVRLGVTTVRLVTASPPKSTCKAIGSITSAIAFSNGLRVGMTRDDVRRVLGSPDASRDRVLEWTRQYEVSLSPQMRENIRTTEGEETLREFPNLQGVAQIVVTFGPDGRAKDIAVTRIETY